MATRFMWKVVLQRRLGSLTGTVTDFRRCIIQGIRCCSSISSDTLVNVHEEPDFPRRRNIRLFCEALSSPSEVSELFNKFLTIPETLRIEALDCSLYWLTYYDKIDAAFELKTLMEKHDIPKGYSTYSVLATLYSKSSQPKLCMTLFEEMIKDGLTPRARHYIPFVEMEAQKGDPIGAFRYLDEWRQSGFILHGRITDVYIAVVRACIGQDSKELRNKVFELFYDIQKYRDLLSYEALETIKLWFDSQKDQRWVTAWSTPSVTYHCQACKQKLETGHFNTEELHKFKPPLISFMLRNRKSPSEVRCYTTAGNYVDYVRPGHPHKFPDSVVRFLETAGTYDVVIDGLNMAYFQHKFDAEMLKNVALHFLKQKKRVLVVGSWPISLHGIKKPYMFSSLPLVMDFLKEHCGVFCLAARAVDDVYLLSAALHSGPGTLLVSSDMFKDHLNDMDYLMKAQFTRWQQLYQVKVAGFVNKNPLFESVRRFENPVHVQTTGDTWHFPCKDGSQWLCVRREDITQ